MKLRLILLCIVSGLIGGCTDAEWDHTVSGMDQTRQTETPAPQPVAASGDEWCRQAAQYERENVASQGFDAATQQHLYEASYRQCMQSPGVAAR